MGLRSRNCRYAVDLGEFELDEDNLDDREWDSDDDM
jgi:hypothetical protein